MEDYTQVFYDYGKKEDGEIIAKTLVEKRLAGCVQIVGSILSTYCGYIFTKRI